MARNRYRNRGSIGVDSTSGNITGILEPPPFSVSGFIYIWKNWLNTLSLLVADNIGEDWHPITAVSTSVDGSSVTITSTDQVVLADPDTGALVINLPDPVSDGLSHYIKNIDESGTYALTVNPGTNKIEQASGTPSTTDVVIPDLDSRHLLFDSVNSTWWII